MVGLPNDESVPDFLLDCTKVHAWADGSKIWGQAGFGIYFPHAEYENISEPVVGPQTNNRAEVSAVRAGIRALCAAPKSCACTGTLSCV